MALVLKKLVTSSSSSVVVPYLRRPPRPNHPRPFITAARSLLDEVDTSIRNRVLMWVLNSSLPYTFCRMTKVTSKGEKRLELSLDENRNMILTDDRLHSFLRIPGIEETKETPEELRVFLDLGMEDIDHQTMKAKLKKKKNAVIINGYVQKQDIRKYYDGRVELPLPPREICEPIKTEIKDGGLVVTIPKKKKEIVLLN